MRDIRFRAWDKAHKCLHTDIQNKSLITEVFNDKIWQSPQPSLRSEGNRERFVFMQFTGLKDRNGKEIYESDVVTTDPDLWEGKNGNWLVKWSSINMGFVFTRSKDKTAETWKVQPRKPGIDGGSPLMGVEVIGNIYENPELLEGF